MRVAVVGGGITGLATAWFLRRRAPGAAVTLYEAGERLGGKIQTDRLGGQPVELGPDTFLARVPWAVELCRQLGLGDELVAPATGKAYVWTRGRLRAIPHGTVFGVPRRLAQLRGVVSAPGRARAALDLVMPASRFGVDPSVADVVGTRLGPEVLERLVEPLIGGIHAGRADRLSFRSVAPQVPLDGRSLMRALRRSDAARPGEGPVFLGLRRGLGRLVERLVECLDGVDIRLASPVTSLDALDADAVVLTIPPPAAAPLVPDASGDLGAIPYASVVTVTLSYPPMVLDGSGFLVPRVDGRLLTACTWTTAKWGRAGDPTLLRASAGRIGDERALDLDDDTLVERLHGELAEAMHLPAPPGDRLVRRWPRALPQYDVGHDARVTRIENALPPNVFVAGAAYRGVGIASCIRQAELVAEKVGALQEP